MMFARNLQERREGLSTLTSPSRVVARPHIFAIAPDCGVSGVAGRRQAMAFRRSAAAPLDMAAPMKARSGFRCSSRHRPALRRDLFCRWSAQCFARGDPILGHSHSGIGRSRMAASSGQTFDVRWQWNGSLCGPASIGNAFALAVPHPSDVVGWPERRGANMDLGPRGGRGDRCG
jgi:hypothetical protein